MSVVTLRIPDEKHERLKQLAERRHVSLNRFLEELTTTALVEHDLAVKFQTMAALGKPERGLELLDKLSTHFGTQLDA